MKQAINHWALGWLQGLEKKRQKMNRAEVLGVLQCKGFRRKIQVWSLESNDGSCGTVPMANFEKKTS